MSVFNDLKNLLHSRFLLFLVFIISFTPLEIMPRCSAAGLGFIIIPAGFNAPLEFLTGFTLLPIISSSHFPIISEAWSATYYVDATIGNDGNTGLSESSAWKTIAKVNAARI